MRSMSRLTLSGRPVIPGNTLPDTGNRRGRRSARFTALLAAILLTAFATGCATSGGKNAQGDRMPSGELRPFTPAHVSAGLQLADGRYPTLFSGTSNAAWLLPSMPLPDAEAEEAAAFYGDQFHVFRVELESVFADMSIAYDAVGLRGLHVYLLTAQNEKVAPIQTIIGTELHEEQRSALRAFRRVSYLLFPKSATRLHVPWTGEPLGTTKLVVDGYDTTFYFEWRPVAPDKLPRAPLSELPAVQSSRERVGGASRRTRDFLRRFD